ncbi:MAG TPA: SRPBCC domain-containing protein [Acidimicrobiia bacterium]|nr:SRPBCC domain-containing protein [Acidimicrobiia bacterium]
MASIRTSIDVEAPIEDVWQILTDLEGHADWNPFIIHAEGSVVEGSTIAVTLQMTGSKPSRFQPVITEATGPTTFEWLGSVGVRGVFDGRHRFDLESTGSGTRVTQSESFTGLLAPIVVPMIRKRTESSFIAMNESLRTRAERSTGRTA